MGKADHIFCAEFVLERLASQKLEFQFSVKQIFHFNLNFPITQHSSHHSIGNLKESRAIDQLCVPNLLGVHLSECKHAIINE